MIVQIKQVAGEYAESTGLAKYNRSRMPRCADMFQPYYDEGKNIYLTGLTDEEAEKYGKLLNVDLSKSSDYWKTFFVRLEADNTKPLNLDIALDYLKYKVLIANYYLCPDKFELGHPKYNDTLYYAYMEEQEDQEFISKTKRKDEALYKLLDFSDNKEKLLLYGRFLEGAKYDSRFSADTLYKLLREFISAKIENTDKFLDALTKSVVEIQEKLIIDKAIKQGVITRVKLGTSKKQVYQYGQITIGSTLPEVYKALGTPEYAPELLAIKTQVESK